MRARRRSDGVVAGLVMRLRGWARSHAQNLLATLGRLSGQPLGSGLTVAVIAIALALPAGLQLLVANARAVSGGWESAVDFSVYLRPGVGLEQAEEVAAAIGQLDTVARVELITAQAALEEFREYSGFGDALGVLDGNPLPHALVVRPAPDLDADGVAALAAGLGEREHVDRVQLDTAWVKRFQGILDIARRTTTMATVLLAVAVVIIIGNTIRLDIQNRRGEIEVMKLIGGSDAFIRRPFLYGGLWYGLLGGVLAVMMIAVALGVLAAPVSRLAGLYGSDFTLRGPGLAGAGALVAGGALLGWLGAWVATARHLRGIEPT